MIKKFSVFSLTLLSVFLLLSGCKTQQKSVSKDQGYTSLDKSLLWEITGDNLSKTSYLFGTIHIIDANEYFLPEGTLNAIENTDEMIFEIDMDDMQDMSKIMGLMEKAYMKDNLTIKDLLSTDDYALLKEHFQKAGMPLMLFERMKPMFLMALAGDMNPGDIKSGKLKSYEMEFADLARDSKMNISGLETIEYQMSIFDSIPYQDQAIMLMESIKSEDSGDDQMDEMINVYKQQDLDAMQEMFTSEDGGLEGHEEVMVFQRNENWIPIMSEMMKSNACFFAVGAGHLGGARGVINLLRKEGYTVKAYK